MKKLLSVLALTFVVVFAFSACNMLPGAPSEKEAVITVEDGYLVVNGVKTDYQVKTDDVIEVEDGYVVVNGNKTEHKVYKRICGISKKSDLHNYVRAVFVVVNVPCCDFILVNYSLDLVDVIG